MLWSKLLQNTICCVKLEDTAYVHYAGWRYQSAINTTEGG